MKKLRRNELCWDLMELVFDEEKLRVVRIDKGTELPLQYLDTEQLLSLLVLSLLVFQTPKRKLEGGKK
jgi:hypothetical protein